LHTDMIDVAFIMLDQIGISVFDDVCNVMQRPCGVQTLYDTFEMQMFITFF